jgi:hypothetical protein
MLDPRRIGAYLVLSFGTAWTTASVIYATGTLAGSQALIPDTPFAVAGMLTPPYTRSQPRWPTCSHASPTEWVGNERT